MHGGVQFACQFTVRLDAHQLGIVVHEFFQHSTACGLVVGVHDVAQGHRLGAVDLANPVAVGKVDSDGCAGGSVSCLSRDVDHVVRDAHHL